MKRLLDKDAQTLVKAGFINGDLELSDDGNTALTSVLFEEKKADLGEVGPREIGRREIS